MSRNLILTRENLLTRSEEFDHGDWAKAGSSVTPNVITAPNGILTADQLIEDNATSEHSVTQTRTHAIGDITFSCFSKANSRTRFRLFLWNVTDGTVAVTNFNLTTGKADVIIGSGTITALLNDWYRCSITGTATVTSTLSRINLVNDSDQVSYTGDGVSNAYLWGAQLTSSGILNPYSKSVSSTVAGPFAGLVITPEYDYKDTGQKFESRHRVRSGAEYVYKWGEWAEKKMSVAFVNSEFKSVVNSWWASNVDLEFQENFNVTSVHLINKSKPVDGLVKPYNDLFRGKIELGTY